MERIVKKLTDRQAVVLSLIKRYINDNGFPPTHLEIALLIGCTSGRAAADHLRLIQNKGYIKIHQGIPRGIQVLDVKEKE